jgi:hypothetical protein
VSGLQAEDGPSVEIGLHSGRELAIAQATMKPVFRKLVVRELDVRKRAASPAPRRRVECLVSKCCSK